MDLKGEQLNFLPWSAEHMFTVTGVICSGQRAHLCDKESQL